MTKRRELLVIVVLGIVLLGVLIGGVCAANLTPEGPVGGGGGGGLAVSTSPLAMTGTIIFSPGGRLHPAMMTNEPGGGGGVWGWIWSFTVGWALGHLMDCATGPTGGCTTANGPVGGGGGGGIPGECESDCSGGGGGWARKAMSWNFFDSDFFTKKQH